MKQVVLDTNFILSCINRKIDFLEDIFLMGYAIIVPQQVLFEMKRIIASKKKLKTREEAQVALKVLKEAEVKSIDLGVTYVDKGLVKYLKDKPEIILATLDAELKKKVNNKKMIIHKQNQLEVF